MHLYVLLGYIVGQVLFMVSLKSEEAIAHRWIVLIVGSGFVMAISHIIAEKLEAAKKTKSLILNCQRLTDVPDAALDSEWCHQHLQSLHLKNNCIRTMPVSVARTPLKNLCSHVVRRIHVFIG